MPTDVRKSKAVEETGLSEEELLQRKRAEEALRIKDSAIASSINAIAFADLEGNLTYVNPSFLKLWGYDDEKEVLGKPAVEFWQMEEKASEVVEALRSRGSWIGELVAKRKDGSLLDVQLSASMVRDEAGKPICLMASLIDITERKRAEEEIQRRLERLRALREIDRAISSSLDLRYRLDVLLDKLTDLPHIDGIAVMVLKPDTKKLETVAVRNLSEEFARMAEVRLRDGLPHLVAEQEKPLVITDLMTNERVVHRDFLKREELASYIGLPLLAKGELIGVLDIYSRERHLWSQEQTDFLHTLAGQAAIAIENARLYEETQRYLGQATALRQIDRAVSSTLDLTERLDIILEQLERVIPYHSAAIFLLTNDIAKVTAARGFPDMEQAMGVSFSVEEDPLTRQVLQEKRPLVLTDAQADERFQARGGTEYVRSWISVPMIVKGEAIGFLTIDHRKPGVYHEESGETALAFASQAAIAIENARAYERLKTQNLETISALAAAVEAKDPYTSGHSEKVTQFAIAIAQEMGVSNDEIEDLRVAGLLHDIGKIGIPDSVLNKPARLTSAERIMVDSHPIISAEIVGKIEALAHLVPIIRHHHERYDGTGYPDGLKGEDIPLLARILAVADGFEAMTSEKPYRRARSEEEALAELQKGAGTQWDPKVVEVFVKIYEEGALKHQAGGQ